MRLQKLIPTVLLFHLMAFTSYSQMAVIANKDVDLTITSNVQLSDVCTMDTKKAPNGTVLVLFNLKKNDLFEKLCNAVNKSSTELKRIWMKMQLSGEGIAPELLDSEDAMLVKVSSTPGALGYVSESKVTQDVKVLYVIK